MPTPPAFDADYAVLAQHYLETVRANFSNQKRLAEKAIAQLDDGQLYVALAAEDNSIAIIIKHLHGNMRSRWRDFLTTDGEKPDRHRDTEFEAPPSERAALMNLWEEGWQTLFEALDSINSSNLNSTITIRGQAHSVLEAIERQLAHYSHHVGQIVYVAKSFKGDAWQTLSIARGASGQYDPAEHPKGHQTQ
jgi:hypothetical protein